MRYALGDVLHDIDWAAGGLAVPSPEFDNIKPIYVLKLALKLALKDMDFSGNEGRYLTRIASEAKPKLNAVEKACYICGRFAGPKFVTTPGAAFSAFASLIYEIATGEKDASMQGAVNRLKAGERPSLSALDWGTDTDRIPTIEMRNIELQYHLRRSRFLVALLKDKEDQYTLFERSLISRIAEANLKEAEAAAVQLATSREAQSKQR